MAKKGIGYNRFEITRHSAPQPRPFRFRTTATEKAIGPPTDVESSRAPEVVPDRRFINGQAVQSENEWNLYQALLALGVPNWSIQYQVPFEGGRTFGGQVLDFVLSGGGARSVIRLMGGHWHPDGKASDVFGLGRLLSEGYVVYDIPDSETKTKKDAMTAVQQRNIV